VPHSFVQKKSTTDSCTIHLLISTCTSHHTHTTSSLSRSRDSLVLWNQLVHSHVRNSPPSNPVPSQMDPVRTVPPDFCKIHSDILPSMSTSPGWSLSLQTSYKINKVSTLTFLPHSMKFLHRPPSVARASVRTGCTTIRRDWYVNSKGCIKVVLLQTLVEMTSNFCSNLRQLLLYTPVARNIVYF